MHSLVLLGRWNVDLFLSLRWSRRQRANGMVEGQGPSAYWLGRGESSYQWCKKTLLLAINNLQDLKSNNLLAIFYPPNSRLFFLHKTLSSSSADQSHFQGRGKRLLFSLISRCSNSLWLLRVWFLVQVSRDSPRTEGALSLLFTNI